MFATTEQATIKQASDSDVSIENNADSESDLYGINQDVLQMKVEDGFKEQDEASRIQEEYSMEYLSKCRQLLMDKVNMYRRQLQHECSNHKKLVSTEERIESIRRFYTNIALAPNRTTRIKKAALSSTHTAKE